MALSLSPQRRLRWEIRGRFHGLLLFEPRGKHDPNQTFFLSAPNFFRHHYHHPHSNQDTRTETETLFLSSDSTRARLADVRSFRTGAVCRCINKKKPSQFHSISPFVHHLYITNITILRTLSETPWRSFFSAATWPDLLFSCSPSVEPFRGTYKREPRMFDGWWHCGAACSPHSGCTLSTELFSWCHYYHHYHHHHRCRRLHSHRCCCWQMGHVLFALLCLTEISSGLLKRHTETNLLRMSLITVWQKTSSSAVVSALPGSARARRWRMVEHACSLHFLQLSSARVLVLVLPLFPFLFFWANRKIGLYFLKKMTARDLGYVPVQFVKACEESI